MSTPPGYRSQRAYAGYLRRYRQMLSDWPTHTEHHVPTRFGSTGVLSCGPQDGPPVVLLHGKYTPSPRWAPVIEGLARHYRLYALDTMGEPGLSRADGDRLRSLADFTVWLGQSLDGLDLDSAHLAGHSFGGHLAARFALAHPRRVRSLTLVEPAQVFAPFTLSMLLRSIPPFLRPTPAMAARYYRWMGQGISDQSASAELAGAGMLAFTGRAPEDVPMRGATLAALAVPAQQLIADRTVVHSPRVAVRRAARHAPHVRSILVHRSSHFLIDVQPAAVLEALATLPGGPDREMSAA